MHGDAGFFEVDPAKQRFAQLYLVDLAGSERVMKTGVQGLQLVEVWTWRGWRGHHLICILQ